MTHNNRYLYLTVFISGMTTLAVELSASRLLGSVFGTSNLVWANVIGLMLLYLTLGYFIGGRLADRYPNKVTLYRILVWAAVFSALIPIVSRPILQIAANAVVDLSAGLVIGSFVAVLVLFSIPVTLLGTVSPFAIRLAVTNIQDAGRVSGQIYAVSTVGSLLGTFLPVLILLPELGTTSTFLLFSGVLYLVAVIGLWRERGRLSLFWGILPPLILILPVLLHQGPLRAPRANAELLYEAESGYNYIQVQQDVNGNRYLYLNEGQGIHSQWHPTQIFYNRTWDFFLTGPYFNPQFAPDEMESLLIIGLATGTIARQHIAIYGHIPMDGVEIDPAIISAGELFFDMNAQAMPSLITYAEDGRYILNQLDKRYTVIGVDAYKPPYIPWHLTTVEFFREIRAHLTDNGVMVINVGRTSTDRRFVEALTHTLLEVYPSVHSMDVPRSFNTILVATVQPTQSDFLAQNLARLPADVNPDLRRVLELGVASLVPTQANEILFTDDRAPVETLVDSLVLNFLLGTDLDALR